MTSDIFEETLRKFLRRKPFYPFQVELVDGTLITVERPTVAFDGGAATYLTEDELIEFACERVRELRAAPIEIVS